MRPRFPDMLLFSAAVFKCRMGVARAAAHGAVPGKVRGFPRLDRGVFVQSPRRVQCRFTAPRPHPSAICNIEPKNFERRRRPFMSWLRVNPWR